MTFDKLAMVIDPSCDIYISNTTFPLLSAWTNLNHIGGDYIKNLDVIRISAIDSNKMIVSVIDNNPNFRD